MKRVPLFIAGLLLLLLAASARAQGTTMQFIAPTKSTAAWTSATSSNTAVTVTVRNLSMVRVTLHATSTMTGGVLSFESDEGSTTWWATPCTRTAGASVSGAQETTFALAVTDQVWTCVVSSFTSFRVRLSTTIAGSGTANVAVLASASPAMANLFSITNTAAIAGAGVGATGSVVPANAVFQGAQDASGNLVGDIVCANSKIYDASTNGNTELVAISGSKHIYVCGYTVFAAGAVNVSLVTGTGTACAAAVSGTPSTGTSGAAAALTPAYQLTAQTGKIQPASTHGWLYDTGSANALCIKTNAGVAVQAEVWYSQR